MPQPIKLKLVGIDGNAFSLMAAFASQAKEEGWTEEQIDAVIKEAKSGDYDHLLATLSENCEDGGLGSDDDDDDEYD